MPKTVKQTVREITELKQLGQVYEAAANMLQTRYISRDSMAALAQISCDGAPVPEAVIEMAIQNFKDLAQEMSEAATSEMGKEVR